MSQQLLLILASLLLVACSSKPRQYSYTVPSYTPPRPVVTSYIAPRPVPIPARPLLSYEELLRFQIDCSRANEQSALLEEQLRRRTFYTVAGVEGNTTPTQINKSYYALAKYRMWTVRFYCQGSEANPQMIRNDLKAFLNQAPTETRCYFKETTELKANNRQANLLNADQTFIRKETCTNHPYITDRPFIRVGDQLQLGGKGLTGDNFLGGLRKWKGNTYQMISKTEIHQNQAVRFTYVTVRLNAHQWAVVDKF
jgi:hypothetical protein